MPTARGATPPARRCSGSSTGTTGVSGRGGPRLVVRRRTRPTHRRRSSGCRRRSQSVAGAHAERSSATAYRRARRARHASSWTPVPPRSASSRSGRSRPTSPCRSPWRCSERSSTTAAASPTPCTYAAIAAAHDISIARAERATRRPDDPTHRSVRGGPRRSRLGVTTYPALLLHVARRDGADRHPAALGRAARRGAPRARASRRRAAGAAHD